MFHRTIALAISLLLTAAVAQAQSGWQSQDIGQTAPGSTSIDSGTFTIHGNGADIYGAQDAFRFVFLLAEGDCEIRARVVSQEEVNDWSKAGVMIRQSLDAGSPHVHINRNPNPSHGIEWQFRTAPNGFTTGETAANANTLPVWLRLVRRGNTFQAYSAPDSGGRPGAWARRGADIQVTMTNPVHVGLSVLSHVGGTLSQAVFDNVETTGTRRTGAGIIIGRAEPARPAPSFARLHTPLFGAASRAARLSPATALAITNRQRPGF